MSFSTKTHQIVVHDQPDKTGQKYYMTLSGSSDTEPITRRVFNADTHVETAGVPFHNYCRMGYRSSGGGQVMLDTKMDSIDSSLSTHGTDIATNTASISANATNIATNVANIASEIANRTSADNALQATIDANMSANAVLITNVANDLATETTARTTADTSINASITTTNTNLTAEVNDREAGDLTLTTNLATTDANLATEIADRISAVAGLQTQITDLLASSPENLNTLAEIVSLVNSGDGTLTSALAGIQSQVDTQRTTADARLDAIEANIYALQNP